MDEVLSLELATELAKLSAEYRRPISLLLTRRGVVQEIIVGTDMVLSPTTLSKFRAGPRSLRGLRLIRTQLQDRPLSQEDLTDLGYLRLDLIGLLSVSHNGTPGTLDGQDAPPEFHRSRFVRQLPDRLDQGGQGASKVDARQRRLLARSWPEPVVRAARTDRDFLGKLVLLYFGYTHCPDVCPTALFEISELYKALGDKGDRMKAFFITVDPERDTPEALRAYLESFDPRIIGLSGSNEAIAEAMRAYRAFARKVPLENGGYVMDHTALVYLMDKTGAFVASMNFDRPPEENAKRVEALF